MERVDEKSHDSDKCVDDFMLPGFRFHPTDEELVEFYLKRKLQHRSLPIELIKQVDIYKYDPWDLPKLASTGEKEWYFYCPRDRKYRNSTRPNRVTGSGFWKATGTDRPIYASDGPKCIGLKKSLVFYRGRAAKGIKTDWMMHEFRLPSATDAGAPPPPPPKKPFDKSFPPTDSWAICRIFKKASSTANRGLSHTWTAASLGETTSSEAFTYTHFTPESDFHHATFYKNPAAKTPTADVDYFPSNLVFSDEPPAGKSTADLTSMFFTQSAAETCKSSGFEAAAHHHFTGGGGYSFDSSQVIQASSGGGGEGGECRKSGPNVWENIRSMGFPFSLQPLAAANEDPWESPPCPSEMSSSTSVTYRL